MPLTPETAPVPELRDYKKEFIAGGAMAALAAIRQALPQYIDDITRDFGSDVYERMVTDPAVDSAIDIIKLGVLSEGIRLEPAIQPVQEWEEPDPQKDADAERSREILDFVQRSLDRSEVPMVELVDELLDGLALGNKVAEVVLEDGLEADAGKLVLKTVKARDRASISFVVDEGFNHLGYVVQPPGQPTATGVYGLVPLGNLNSLSNFCPKDKTVAFVHRPKNTDPRGTSILRSAYLPWFLKTQVLPDFFRYLKQFATPGIVGKTSKDQPAIIQKIDDNGKPVTKQDGSPDLQSAETALYNALMAWVNAYVLVVPGGTDIDFRESQGDGAAFRAACDYFDRQIHLAILNSTRASMEAQHGSKADSQTGQDVAGLPIGFYRGRVADCIQRSIVRLLVLVNFGQADLRLAPKVCLAKVEQQDFAQELSAVSSAYGSGFIHDSQLPALDARLGLPPRDMEAMAREKEERNMMDKLSAGMVGKLSEPGSVEEELP